MKFGTYGTEQKAQDRISLEEQYGMYGRFTIVPVYVGKSIDPAYSDMRGYAYEVYAN